MILRHRALKGGLGQEPTVQAPTGYAGPRQHPNNPAATFGNRVFAGGERRTGPRNLGPKHRIPTDESPLLSVALPQLIGYDGRMTDRDTSHARPDTRDAKPAPLALLDRAGAKYRTHEHAPLVSAEDFRAHSPFPPAAMVKTLVFRTPDGGYALAALKAFDKLDYKKLADALGIRRADLRAAETDEITRDLGFEIGGVCPLSDRANAQILIDPGVETLATVFCGTGLNTLSLEIAGAELVRASGGRLAAIAK